MNTNFITPVKNYISDHKIEIAAGACMAMGLSATVSAVPATVKAVNTVYNKEDEIGRKLTKKEIVKLTWKYYIPTFVLSIGQTVFGTVSVNNSVKSIGALAAASELSEVRYKNLERSLEESIPDREHKNEIKEKADEYTARDVSSSSNPMLTELFAPHISSGEDLFYDTAIHRWFYSNPDYIQSRVDYANMRFRSGDERLSVWDLADIYKVPLNPEEVSWCDMNGWEVDSVPSSDYIYMTMTPNEEGSIAGRPMYRCIKYSPMPTELN